MGALSPAVGVGSVDMLCRYHSKLTTAGSKHLPTTLSKDAGSVNNGVGRSMV